MTKKAREHLQKTILKIISEGTQEIFDNFPFSTTESDEKKVKKAEDEIYELKQIYFLLATQELRLSGEPRKFLLHQDIAYNAI